MLADPSGVVVAGAGAWALRGFAAYAPLLASAEPTDAPRLDAMRTEVEIRHLEVCGQEVYLCARSRGARDKGTGDLAMTRAAEGISRILSAA